MHTNFKVGDKVRHKGFPDDQIFVIKASDSYSRRPPKHIVIEHEQQGKTYIVSMSSLRSLATPPPDAPPKLKIDHDLHCRIGNHEKAKSPIQLAEKSLQWWIVCKHCGKALHAFDEDKDTETLDPGDVWV